MANPNIVSVTSILGGNAGFNLSATATDTLLTVDADKLLKINRITVANVDGTNAATFDLFIDGLGSGASGVTTTGADSTLVVVDSPIYLMEVDILKGGASAASDLDLFVSYEVIDDA